MAHTIGRKCHHPDRRLARNRNVNNRKKRPPARFPDKPASRNATSPRTERGPERSETGNGQNDPIRSPRNQRFQASRAYPLPSTSNDEAEAFSSGIPHQ